LECLFSPLRTILNWVTTMIRITIIFILIISLITHSCRDEYFPEIDKYENILTVDGTISNDPGPYEVRLSLSSPVYKPELKPYVGAQVIVIDDLGNKEYFSEIEPGLHRSSPEGMQGVVGRKYKIVINTPDEEIYESDFQEIIDPVEIDRVYEEIEYRQGEEPWLDYHGYQFYVDAKQAESDTTFLLWKLKATYEYHSDFRIQYYFDGQLNLFPDNDSLYYCWANDNITSNLTMSTVGLLTPVITRLPLNFVSNQGRKLSVTYSLLVKQYTINETAFAYYSQIQSISSEQGLFYSQQPYQVKGNIVNRSEPDEPVLGYFLVGGKEEKRVFVGPPTGVGVHYQTCEISGANYEAYRRIRWTDPRQWPLYVNIDLNYTPVLMHQACVDCRQKGGTIIKPDYWED